MWDGFFYILDASEIGYLSQYVKTQTKVENSKWELKKNHDNVDDDYDHGEEWIKNPLFIAKYGVNFEIGE